jgi:nucleotide-binding universal stress UspA family protein
MQRFKKILVVATGAKNDATAIKRAVGLAKSNAARITVLDVIPSLSGDSKKLFKIAPPDKLEELLKGQRTGELEKLAASIDLTGIDLDIKVLVGTDFVEVIREVLREGHDLVVKAAEGRGGQKERLFGSTDLHLMRECPGAVWIVKAAKSRKHPRILAAVDPDPSDEDKNRLNGTIMELGKSLSEQQGSELHVVHTWVLYSEPLLRLLIGDVDKLARDTRKTHRKWLDALLDSHSIPHRRRCVHLIRGESKDVIPELAMKQKVDLIVMGTAARSGLPQFLIGNTAEDVLNRVDCSVLTVKQEGFISPITLEERPKSASA